jgi:amino acid transporter
MRRDAIVLGAVTAAVMTLGARASAALADSEPPPPDVVTSSNTGTLVIISLSVVVIVLVSLLVLRGISRTRRERRIEEEYRARRRSGEAGTAPETNAGTPEGTP